MIGSVGERSCRQRGAVEWNQELSQHQLISLIPILVESSAFAIGLATDWGRGFCPAFCTCHGLVGPELPNAGQSWLIACVQLTRSAALTPSSRAVSLNGFKIGRASCREREMILGLGVA